MAYKKWKHTRRHRLYRIWCGMRKRCFGPTHHEYHRYGGRGITICDEWKQSYDAFFDWAIKNGYQDELTIERKNVNGNYAPDNCTWIPKGQQARNRSTSVLVSYKGEVISCAELSRSLGFKDKHTVLERLRAGMTIDEIISTPSRYKRIYCIAGEVGTIEELAKKHGLKRTTLENRVRRGMPEEKIFEQPNRRRDVNWQNRI